MLHSPALAWQNLAFLDTPGYSKADTQGSAQSDAAIAQRQLSEADHVLWLLNAKNGSIRSDDLDFLRTLNPSQPVFFVVTQADLVGESRIQAILNSTQEAINNAGIPCAGLMAWAAPVNAEGRPMAGENISDWLDNISKKPKFPNHEKLFESIFSNYIEFYTKNESDAKSKIDMLRTLVSSPDLLSGKEINVIKNLIKDQEEDLSILQKKIPEFSSMAQKIKELVAKTVSISVK